MEPSLTNRFPWNLDWNLLRTFTVVVESRSITIAANTLGLTQPSVSSALKRLEETLGVRLIDRNNRHFEPTLEGLRLFEECRKVFGIVSDIPGLVELSAKDVTGQISIAMTSGVGGPHLDQLLSEFDSQHPNVDWTIPVSESREVVNHVRQGRVSIGLCLLETIDTNLESHVLYRQRFQLYCGRNHRFFGVDDIDVADLAGEASISFQTDSQTGPLFAVHELRHQVKLNPKLKGVSASLPEVRRMIVAGMGIGALPVHVAQRDVDSKLLWPLPPYDPLPVIEMYALWNPTRRLNRAEETFLDALKNLLNTVPIEERSY